jgi:4-hydroxyphenylpyruvate dioxygenase
MPPETDTQARPNVPQTDRQGAASGDQMPLLGIDHVELYVGNATQAAYWFTHALGFHETAYAGLETGVRDRASHVLEQGRVRFVLTAPLLGTSEIARHVAAHGDGVRVIALGVPDAEHAYRHAVQHGARGVREPWEESDDGGTVRMATVATYGETLHTFVERDGYEGNFLPGFAPGEATADAGLFAGIDHVVGNVELGRLDEWVDYYERVFGMTEMIHFTDEDIGTEYSALMSKVMADGKGRVKFPINEPAEGQRKSQIEEYLEYYGGPGAQHIALATTDIVATIKALKQRGVRFLDTPDSYYEELPGRIGEIDEDLADLRELGILADRDDEGYLLQIFTQTIGDRPTVFLEVIERHGARGFGEGNFKALFEAIEREQEKRGNL